ncbi:MAG: glycosyl transferase family 8 [archaeon]
MQKKFVIITSSDSKYGDFLADHWLKSLKVNLDTDLVDIVVLDYGLTSSQKNKLRKDVKIVKCVRDGHLVNIRFRDMLNFLKKSKYEQIISSDGGDIIFQKDITSVFYDHPSEFRIVAEGIQIPNHETSIFSSPFDRTFTKQIMAITKGKKTLNCGFIVAPVGKFKALCNFVLDKVNNLDLFGPDQVAMNYFLYKNGFHELSEDYNFIIATAKKRFSIKNGVFLNELGKPIAVVHNTGGKDRWRPVSNFGYGSDRNRLKFFVYHWLRFAYFFSFITIPVLRLYIKLFR